MLSRSSKTENQKVGPFSYVPASNSIVNLLQTVCECESKKRLKNLKFLQVFVLQFLCDVVSIFSVVTPEEELPLDHYSYSSLESL